MNVPKSVLDKTGWIDISVSIGWTLILGTAMAFLFYHRQLPALQIRRIPLVLTSVILLHVYWIISMTFYVVGKFAPCGAEYWIMSIYLPFGVAIFQVANTQFLHIATQQKRFTSAQSLDSLVHVVKHTAPDHRDGHFLRRMMRRLRSVDRLSRIVLFIGMGMAVQVILTLVIYLLSRKFHPSYGLLPADLSGTDSVIRRRCSRGWEWWPSIFWQFFWSWLYAPYILWKSRDIEDTHGWRVQTILCCVAGLPASPLWLCALYVPQFAPLDAVFIAPQWFSVSIFFVQAFAIFIPCYQVFKQHNLRQETLQAIAAWESKSGMADLDSLDSESTKAQGSLDTSFKTMNISEKELIPVKQVSKPTSVASISSRKSHLHTMAALEHALKWNPAPLQMFSALRDFSGENISFLTHLATWKKTWIQVEREKFRFNLPSDQANNKENVLRGQFNCAIKLYAAFVSVQHAEFPINISSKTLRALDNMFADATETVFGDEPRKASNITAIPFDVPSTISPLSGPPIDVEKGATVRCSSPGSDCTVSSELVWYWGPIPADFTAKVFDDAEGEIKYLVLTNTWPKFVNAGFAEQVRNEEGGGLGKWMGWCFFWRQNKL